MRTTLTLDDDVAAHLRRLAQETGRPFKQVVNDALRAGLEAPRTPSTDVPAFPTYRLGLRAGINLDRARHLAAAVEDDEIVAHAAILPTGLDALTCRPVPDSASQDRSV